MYPPRHRDDHRIRSEFTRQVGVSLQHERHTNLQDFGNFAEILLANMNCANFRALSDAMSFETICVPDFRKVSLSVQVKNRVYLSRCGLSVRVRYFWRFSFRGTGVIIPPRVALWAMHEFVSNIQLFRSFGWENRMTTSRVKRARI